MSRQPNSRQLRAIGHKLKPVVTVAGNGIHDGLIMELNRALNDHELIKVKVAVGSRESRDEVLKELLDACGATLIQRIGNTALVLKRSDEPDPNKSNLLRHSF